MSSVKVDANGVNLTAWAVVDISKGEDDVLILASTVVIDMCVHGDNKK